MKYSTKDNTSPHLDADGILRVQSIVGALMLYGQAVNNKILVALSELGQKQAAATQATNNAVLHLLYYVATYPSDGITFRARKTILSTYSDSAYLNVTKARSCAGANIMLSENVTVPSYNGPILTIAQIIRNGISSAAEAELAGLFICAKEMVPIRQVLN